MHIHTKLVFLILLFTVTNSCSTNKSDETVYRTSNCSIGQYCVLSGAIDIFLGTSGSVGVLNTSDSKCIALALDESVYKNKIFWDEKLVTVRGYVYSQNSALGVISYILNDRLVSAGVCETGLIIYVDSITKVQVE